MIVPHLDTPLAVFGSATRFVCDHCRAWMANWLKRRRRKLSQKGQSLHPQKEQRQHPRYHVEFPATVSTAHHAYRFGMISDLSVRGCKVKSKTTVVPGEFGKVLINVPTGFTPVTVSLASVRWVKGYECGLEFLLMDPEEQSCLTRTAGQLELTEPVPAVVS
jgi:hypothetical protein